MKIIWNPDGTATIQIGGGDRLKLNADGTVQGAASPATGDRSKKLATMEMFANEFGASLTANGYQKLPNGLIIQWGQITGTTTTTVTKFSANLPVAFPNAKLGTWAVRIDNLYAANNPTFSDICEPDISKTQASVTSVRSSGSGITTWNYLVIGW